MFTIEESLSTLFTIWDYGFLNSLSLLGIEGKKHPLPISTNHCYPSLDLAVISRPLCNRFHTKKVRFVVHINQLARGSRQDLRSPKNNASTAVVGGCCSMTLSFPGRFFDQGDFRS
jgi:hypothetical protein